MAINTAVNTANLANKAAQVGFAQTISAPKETKQTEEPRRVQHLDEEGLDSTGQSRDNVEKSNMEDATGVSRQRTDAVRRDGGERRQVQGRTESSATSDSGKTGQAKLESTGQQAPGPQAGDVGTRTLRLALADNSRQLQAQFDTQQNQPGTQANMGPDARRTVMLRNMQSMVNTQLAQFTGNEPYSRNNYRQILGALAQMQGGNGTGKKDETQDTRSRDDGWGSAEGTEQKDGAYKLYSGQAQKVLAYLAPEPERSAGDEPLSLVA